MKVSTTAKRIDMFRFRIKYRLDKYRKIVYKETTKKAAE